MSADKEYVELLKKHHFCLDCRKQDAYTFSGYTYCFECNEKRNNKAKEYRLRNRDKILKKRMERYEQCKLERKCVICGRNLGKFDFDVYCLSCKARRSKARSRNYQYKRVPWMCYQCTKKPPIEGKKLCVDCYEKNVAKLNKMLQARKIKREEAMM